ncbi:MAG: hypothetical protein AW07_01001 [Candidatus Accumulibacter sp. SK-11]|nr:MAG: hypothetical protein AW07_01001 [Candidatus Accumulibacter sp. SK-11]
MIPSMITPSGASTCTSPSDSVVGVVKACQLSAENAPTRVKTNSRKTVRSFMRG